MTSRALPFDHAEIIPIPRPGRFVLRGHQSPSPVALLERSHDMATTDVDHSYAADAALEAAEAVVGARDWIADDAARAELAEMARALVGLALEMKDAAGSAYLTPGAFRRRLDAMDEILQGGD